MERSSGAVQAVQASQPEEAEVHVEGGGTVPESRVGVVAGLSVEEEGEVRTEGGGALRSSATAGEAQWSPRPLS